MTLENFIRMIIVAFGSYAVIVLVLRISGKRTLSKMNAFDFIVTVALGSVLANILVNHETLLWEGLFAFCLLVLLQYISTWLSVRSSAVRSLLKSEPSLIYYDDHYDNKKMKKERITEREVIQAIRKDGYISLDEIAAVILESDGTLTVMEKSKQKHLEQDDFFL
ncbi:DUF421 domain-containing protein [Alkalibacterium pelagium]|uniref:Uncharacterized membrane protein YcaP, DUF421 family n=1 Tax=Alkalibacterium pelagium TaxID=426702 RepID=A0A1H7N1G2_9LACT|nr:YetF domain-containing protein [Alkalibacterium pelagium]GEN51277.1 DUF421 domain-containing protein [Alkalibacterium pelagium]SEL16848.1 Uncharacterized membrane protein YcaP, DUF421 family [Alkalibacterium pelagium]